MGYSETSKAYKAYILELRKTVVSVDVKLEEDFASRKCHEPIPVTKDDEQQTPKVEPISLMNSNTQQQPLDEKGTLTPPILLGDLDGLLKH